MSAEIIKALGNVEAKFNEFKTEQSVLAERMLNLEQKGGSLPGEFTTRTSTLGEQFRAAA